MTKNTITYDTLEFGKIYTCFIYYDIHDTKGKKRPVIIFKNKNQKVTIFQVSTKIDTPFNKKYGYPIEDWKSCGFKKPSVINTHPKDVIEIPQQSLTKIIGELSDKDKIGLLEKHIEINKRLLKERNHELER